MLRLARLSLFMRIILKSPPSILEVAVLQSKQNFKKGWVHSLMGDLKWITACDDFACGSNWNSLDQWVSFLSVSPKSYLNKIKAFCKLPFANIPTQWATSNVLLDFSRPLVCGICGKVSYSNQAHSVHLASSHNIKCKFRCYVDGPTCRICLKNFDTRERCLNHAKKCKVCRVNLLARGPVISIEEAEELDSSSCAAHQALYAAGKRRHFAAVPVMVSHGPLLPIIALSPSTHHALGVGYNYH